MNIGCDQMTKNEIRSNIRDHERIHILENNLILTKVENTGAAMSFGQDFSPVIKLLIFQVFPVLVMLYLCYYLVSAEKKIGVNFIAMAFIIGGGIGNVIDRVIYQSVTDFVYLEFGPLHTGIFNMADLSVTIGVLALIINALVHGYRTNYEGV